MRPLTGSRSLFIVRPSSCITRPPSTTSLLSRHQSLTGEICHPLTTHLSSIPSYTWRQIDLLVQEGLYANRTDSIRTALRNQLNAHAEAIRQTVVRKELALGLHASRAATWRRYLVGR
ncbi:MAG TPA: hypothetical protein VK869_04710 [Rubrobacteraceae bacterium]|nr:hypothetical protein [Rubrobacteraceae bacterium]